jgi:hypothetical protein
MSREPERSNHSIFQNEKLPQGIHKQMDTGDRGPTDRAANAAIR